MRSRLFLAGGRAHRSAGLGHHAYALVVMFGDQRVAFKAFDEVVDHNVARVALDDTYSDEKAEAIMAAEVMRDLYAVRLDTPASRRGSMTDLIREVRWELDVRGFKKVKIFVSGGLDDRSIPELVAAGADGANRPAARSESGRTLRGKRLEE